jgi:response regulator RpfG family c-di-GMP phosphodiesterase
MTVLCVDDEPNILKSLQRLLAGQGFELLLAQSGTAALQQLANRHVDLVMSDMKMPQMSGAEFLTEVARLYPATYRIILSGYADMESTLAAVNQGQIHRYLQKPWHQQDLLTALRDGLDKVALQQRNTELQQQLQLRNQQLEQFNQQLEQRVEERTSLLRQLIRQLQYSQQQLQLDQHSTLKILYNIISSQPLLDGAYAQNVSKLAGSLAQRSGLDKDACEQVALAGLLAELGLLTLPAELIQKPLYQLDLHQRQRYLQHPQQAQLLMAPATHLHAVADMIAHQYERFNGTGSPDQLIGEQIPLGARIVALARDFWGFMLQRLHKEKLNKIKSLQQIKLQIGNYYDPQLVQLLEQLVERMDDALVDDTVHPLTTAKLRPGMQLLQALYNDKAMLLLPEGHVFSSSSILRIRQLEQKTNQHFTLQIKPD